MRPLHAIAAVAMICIVTVIRIATTHAVFSPTYDEPLHIPGGYEFVAEHHYRISTDNPPLARAVFAWPLRHAHPMTKEGLESVGQIYDSAGDYMTGVVRSRRGNLIFVVLAIAGVALLAGSVMDASAAVMAAFVFAMLPTTLALGGLATTDMAGTAAFAFALLALISWVRRPAWRETVWLGVAFAFVFLTKFSVAPSILAAAAVICILWRTFPLKYAIAGGVIALFLIYGVYASVHAAPRFLLGIQQVVQHSREGQDAFLLGEVRHTGWWYYFPIALGVKTPIALLLLAGSGMAMMKKREDFAMAAIAGAILAIGMTSKADLGVRHILPIYVPLSLLAARGTRSIRAMPLCAWLIVGSFLAHPDYLPWMNAFAGSHPEQVLLDSNFDWGQDVVRLRDACRAKGIQEIGVAIFGTVDMKRIGMPPVHDIDPIHASPGWYAVSESFIIPAQVRDPRAYTWLTRQPFERIGKTIRLYRVEPGARFVILRREDAEGPPAENKGVLRSRSG